MPTTLIVSAGAWNAKAVKCSFTVKAGGTILTARDRDGQIFDLPVGTTDLEITAKPRSKSNAYWEATVSLTVAGSGTVSPKPEFAPRVQVMQASSATRGATLVMVKLSRFKDVTAAVRDLLKVVPGTPGKPRLGGAPDATELGATYGVTWPPNDLDIPPRPGAHYLDAANPVKAGGILRFATDSSSKVEAESVVLELAGVRAPRLFGVVWPKDVERKANAAPTPFFFYIRQTGGQDRKNVFVHGGVKGAYPYNFDYAERCLYESQHYPPTPIFVRKGWMLRPKGVPYQVAKSGAKVVTVFPVADSNDGISYGVLSKFDEMGRLLAELQAFMFWRAGVAAPPDKVGNTAIGAYSSANYTLVNWLELNRTSTFLKNNVRAVYFLDPPGVDDCVTAGLNWRARMGNDKRVRLYSARDQKRYVPGYRRLLGLKAKDPALPSPPYLLNVADNKVTLALFPTESWIRTFKDVINVDIAWTYWDAHHFVPATVLTHALSDHAVAGRDL